MEEKIATIDNDDTKMISRIIMQEDITVSTVPKCVISVENRDIGHVQRGTTLQAGHQGLRGW